MPSKQLPEERSVLGLIKRTLNAWLEDRGQTLGASLSYYTVFSLAPLLLIVVSVAGLLFGVEAARGQIFDQLKSLLGSEGASAVEAMLRNANRPSTGVWATIVGAVTLLVGATSVFAELQDTLDHVWRAPQREKVSGLWTVLHQRLLSVGMILGIAFLLMVSLVLGAILSALQASWNPVFGEWTLFASGLNLVIGFGLTTLVFALIYKVMPRANIAWRDVWIGAVVTAGLFTLGKYLIGLYLGHSSFSSTFGAAGSLVVVLVWVYYSAQILLLGAEFTWAYAHLYGSRGDATLHEHADPPHLGAAHARG
jgi:membrane protein